jgi:ATPase subunit of ABC transporter with duplicated ATPase domains
MSAIAAQADLALLNQVNVIDTVTNRLKTTALAKILNRSVPNGDLLNREFDLERHILVREISRRTPLSFLPGCMIVFVGPNGSGKSLALREIESSREPATPFSPVLA